MTTGTKAPISLHPAFPAVVALWFAMLLGLGMLVLPGALIERAVGATGLGELLPAANPPLGMTARTLLALAGAAVGAGLGLQVARKVAEAHAATSAGRPVPVRRPISAHEELGSEGFDRSALRRRAVNLAEAAPAIDEPPPQAPPAAVDDEPPSAPAAEIAPSDSFAPAPEAGAPLEEQEAPMTDRRPSLPPVRPAPAPVEATAPPPAWAADPLDDLGMVQLVQRLGAALERRRAKASASGPVRAVAPAPVAPAEDWEAARAEEAARARSDYFGSAASPRLPDAAEREADAFPAANVPPASDVLDAWEDFAEDEDLAASFTLPLGRATPAADEEAAAEEDEGEYGSLLAIRKPHPSGPHGLAPVDQDDEDEETLGAIEFPWRDETARRPFDPPPAEAAAGPEFAADAADADEVLRRALATLQRTG